MPNNNPRIAKKKIRILVIAPYNGLKNLFERIAGDMDEIELSTYVSDTRDAAEFVKTISLAEFDIVISRGYTCTLIEEACGKHVLDVGISIYDVLAAIKSVQNYEGKFAFVGFQSVIYLATIIKDILNYDFDVYTLDSIQQIRPTLLKLKRQGYTMIVGDVVTTTYASQVGLQSILILTSEESVRKILIESINLYNEKEQILKELLLYQTILNNLPNEDVTVFSNSSILFSTLNLPDLLSDIMKKSIPEIEKNSYGYIIKSINGIQYELHGTHIKSRNASLILYTIHSQKKKENQIMIHIINTTDELIISQRIYYSLNSSMQKILTRIQDFKYYSRPIMITGPLYCGKSEMAKYIYNNNPEKKGPFIIVDCNRFQQREWEQFLNKSNSPFYQSGSTIFFQDISNLTIENQRQLLYYLEISYAWKRNQILFSSSGEKCNNSFNLETEISHSVRPLTLAIPSLNDRKEDIPNLATLYLNDFNSELDKTIVAFTPGALKLLQEYNWTGNLIQFQNVIHKSMLLSDEIYITEKETAEALSEYRNAFAEPKVDNFSREGSLEDITKSIISQVLQEEGGNQSKAAKRLNISRSTLRRHLGL